MSVFNFGNPGNSADKAFFESTVPGFGFNGGIGVTYVMQDDLTFDNVENFLLDDDLFVDNGNIFDGNGKTIYLNTSLPSGSCKNLFVGVNGTIKNLRVVQMTTNVFLLSSAWVCGWTGVGGTTVTIDNCHVECFNINGYGIGSICGDLAGSGVGGYCLVKNCTAAIQTTPVGTAFNIDSGGIVGRSAGSDGGLCEIVNCKAIITSTIYGYRTGGIVGGYAAQNGGTCIVTNCVAEVNTIHNASGGIVGGYAGFNGGTCIVTNCYRKGSILPDLALVANDYRGQGGIIGGFAGVGTGGSKIIVSNCFYSGNITSLRSGGITGENFCYNVSSTGKIFNCVSSCAINATLCSGVFGALVSGVTSTVLVANCIIDALISLSFISTSYAFGGRYASILNCFYNDTNGALKYPPATAGIIDTNNNPYTSIDNVDLSPNYYGNQIFLRYAPTPHVATVLSFVFVANNDHPVPNTGTEYEQSELTPTQNGNLRRMGIFGIETYLGTLPGIETVVFWLPNANVSQGKYEAFLIRNHAKIGDLVEYKYIDVDNTTDSNIYTANINFNNQPFDEEFYIRNIGLSSSVIDGSNTGANADKVFFETTVSGSGFNGATNTTFTLSGDLILDYVENYTIIDITDNNVFDGNGYTITLQSNESAHFPGLFNILNGTVNNLKVIIGTHSGLHLTNKCGWIGGGYCGYGVGKNCLIQNCFTSFDETTGDYDSIGGIVGSNAGGLTGICRIINCQSNCNISGIGSGGIVGDNASNEDGLCEIFNCQHSGSLIGFNCGGIVGQYACGSPPSTAGKVIIANCNNIGILYGSGSGGIAGSNFGYNDQSIAKIFNCVCDGEINDICGGIVGVNAGNDQIGSVCLISHCMSTAYAILAFETLASGIVCSDAINVTLESCLHNEKLNPYGPTTGTVIENNTYASTTLKILNLSPSYEGYQVIFRYETGINTVAITSSSETFSEDNSHPSSLSATEYEQSYLSSFSKPYTVGTFTIDPFNGNLPSIENVVFWLPNANTSSGSYKVFNDADDAHLGDLIEFKSADVDNSINSNLYTASIDFGSDTSPMNFYIQNFSLVCVHEDTHVLTQNGFTKIKDIRSGDIVYDNINNEHKIIHNIKLNITNEYVSISKNSLGENKPQNDLLIKECHPLLIDNNEIECQKLVNNSTIRNIITDNKYFIYTLVTEKRVFINMENLYVCTWKVDDWNKYSVENKIPYIKM
jgi:hypothetical protein